ncbi:hypothetical protein ACWOFR_02495 [Carnobacterium gallinarum]|uniref:hypothetical protein n=1 Tax=Carnobacterium gallinarum TaxID=2749 RepID=UPI0005509B49|nr:hypothetical protein [Carnobacterium gallinarum]
MNQGHVKDLSKDEQTELQEISDLIFVETIADGFYELKNIQIKLPEGIPHGRIYTRDKIGDLLLNEKHFSILIETNDNKYLYQSSTVKIPEYHEIS